MKKIAILQSNYIPWKGYFDLINMVDDFIFYDSAQYTKNDWRNRNKIKTKNGLEWITIPVSQKNLHQTICDTTISTNDWNVKHWKTISQNYSKAPYFKKYAEIFENLYLECKEDHLSNINYRFISAINAILDIKTNLHWSSDFTLIDGKSERLLGLCQDFEANIYLSGPAAKDYLDESLFTHAGIHVEWMDYSGYPVYDQLNPPFEHGVSVLDLIFNEGPNAPQYMKSFKP